MIKKFVGIILFIFLVSQSAIAQTIAVRALEDFSTENPSKTLSVQALEGLWDNNDKLVFKGGEIVVGNIENVKSPKRMKRNASFTFVPVSRKSENGIEYDITENYIAKYTTLMNKADLAKHAALGVGNYFVKGLSMGYSAVEGAIKNEKDNRFKSSVNAVYEDSPVSFVKKGQDIVIKKDQIFLLNFKIKHDDEEPVENSEV